MMSADSTLVPAHMRDDQISARGFCPGGEEMQPNGRCKYGCDHADHYVNDGHLECEWHEVRRQDWYDTHIDSHRAGDCPGDKCPVVAS